MALARHDAHDGFGDVVARDPRDLSLAGRCAHDVVAHHVRGDVVHVETLAHEREGDAGGADELLGAVVLAGGEEGRVGLGVEERQVDDVPYTDRGSRRHGADVLMQPVVVRNRHIAFDGLHDDAHDLHGRDEKQGVDTREGFAHGHRVSVGRDLEDLRARQSRQSRRIADDESLRKTERREAGCHSAPDLAGSPCDCKHVFGSCVVFRHSDRRTDRASLGLVQGLCVGRRVADDAQHRERVRQAVSMCFGLELLQQSLNVQTA